MIESRVQSPQTKRTVWFLLLAIVLLAAALRIYNLSTESYWLDEVIMVKITQSDLPIIMESLGNGRPPIYVMLGYAWVRIFGASEAATRSLSAIAGLISIPIVFLIGRRMFNNTVGLLAALLTTLSVFHIYYSQEYRYYSVVILFTVLTFYFYIRALETGRVLNFILYVICGIGIFYTHTFAMFVLVAPGLYFLLQFRRYRPLFWKWFIAEIVLVLGMLPGIWLLVSYLFSGAESSAGSPASPNAWITPPTFLSPFRTSLNYIFYNYAYINIIFVAIAGLLLVIGIILYLLRRNAQERQTVIQGTAEDVKSTFRNPYLLLLLLWFVLPIIIPLLLSLSNILGSGYLDRYLSTGAVALFLLIAVIMYSLRKSVPIVLSLAAYILIIFPALYTYYHMDIKEQWRELAEEVAVDSQPQDTIAIAYADFPEYRIDAYNSFYWYYPGDADDCFVDLKLQDAALINQLKTCNSSNNHFWIVIHGDNPQRMQTLEDYLSSTQQGELLTTEKYLGTSAYLFQISELG
ncbi:MAG: glycosyltransferase family 39 protein [Anaerolineae bacterium]|nr:glycosyltransferase family 39 protein [Anaerolineae bacterium]